MAYKFQLGAAVLSGSIKAEDGLVATDVDDTTAANIIAQVDAGEIPIAKLAAKTISGKDLGTNLDALSLTANSGLAMSANYNGSAGVTFGLSLDGLAAAAVNVAADSIAIYDADGDTTAKESIADLITAVAGNGLAASSGVLAVGVDDSSIELNSDAVRVKASGVTNAMLAGSIANGKLANSTISGVSLGSNLNALSLAANSGLAISANYNGSAAVTFGLSLDGLAAADVSVANDFIAIYDADADATKKEAIADVVTAIAGNGLAASSGVLAVGVDDSSIELNSDALRVKASGVTNAMLAGSIANAKLANSAITIAGSSTSLGGSITSAAILNVDMGGDFTIGNQSDDVATFSGGVVVSGDLTVSGTTTTVNSTTVNLQNGFIFEGATADAHETTLTMVDPTADATINLPAMSAGTYYVPVLAAASTVAIDATPAEINAIADASARSAAAVDVAADHFMFCDGGATGAYKVESIADLITAVAGDGLAASSGVLAVGVDDSSIELNSDALRVKASGITNAMLAGSIADSKLNTISTAGKVALSAIELDGGTDIGADLVNADLIMIDDGANGTMRKCTMERVKAYIGSGTANVNLVGDANATLEVGINAPSANASQGRTWTLPASAGLTVGESVVIKGYGNAGTYSLTIAQAGSQEIDGSAANIQLESDNAAITLYYVAADTWIIV